ncbi:glycine-rich domain-containing protein [Streptosporangium sp. NPDC002721]|uniref:glycine-rich domain-containing protein n=1 Tax=Streptosporangium sp. NPDC002721 TaxID=3366188 RepID=UPI0036840965
MTITTERPALTTAHTLITPKLFNRLTARIAVDHPEHTHQADVIMEQALAFLATCAANPGAGLGPSSTVDIGWHTFLMYTREYAAFCQKTAGRFIHHAPDDEPGEPGAENNLATTMAAMEAAGYRVDPIVWPTSADCGNDGGGRCNQCHAGCYDSPKKAVG